MVRSPTIGMILAAALSVAAGCSTNVEREDSNAPPAAPTASPTAAPSSPSAANPTRPTGPAAPGSNAAAPEAPSAGDHQSQLQQVAKLDAAYKRSPGDAALKQKLVAAKYDYATSLMDDANVPPRMKYRPALQQYNDLLKLEPGYKDAEQRKKAIEEIYRSMGMPIPQ